MTPRPTFRTLNKVLLICGCERRLFLSGLFVGLGMFLCFANVVLGVSIFAAFVTLGYFHARDPVKLVAILSVGRKPAEYDPAKRSNFVVQLSDEPLWHPIAIGPVRPTVRQFRGSHYASKGSQQRLHRPGTRSLEPI